VRVARAFPCSNASPAAARAFVDRLASHLSTDRREEVEVMVSELATNCVRHAVAAFEVAVERLPGSMRVEVTDAGGGQPVLRMTDALTPSGRGLRLVDLMSDDWGIDRTDAGATRVWFVVTQEGAGDGSSSDGTQAADGRPSPARASASTRPRQGPGASSGLLTQVAA